jgi:hypothetical protein
MSADREQVSGEAEVERLQRLATILRANRFPLWADEIEAALDSLRAFRQERPRGWADAQSLDPDDHFGKPAAGPLPADREQPEGLTDEQQDALSGIVAYAIDTNHGRPTFAIAREVMRALAADGPLVASLSREQPAGLPDNDEEIR